jgi:hypothetical protein
MDWSQKKGMHMDWKHQNKHCATNKLHKMHQR